MRAKLKLEFEVLDLNRDGMVTIAELQEFLDAKVCTFFFIIFTD